MKKILVNVDEVQFEKVRASMQKRIGTKQSNSDVVNHLVFLFVKEKKNGVA